MDNSIFVISNTGKRLMSTFRPGRVRYLLKDGKAKIVKRNPFTIQLLYETSSYVQPVEICEDVGYNYIGISIKSNTHEYVSAQFDTLQNEKSRHDDCRKLRHMRRNRLRYRKPRFDNRRRNKGWLAPSLEHKKQLNIDLIKRYVSVIPVTHVTVEVGSFDTMLLQAIKKGEVVPEGIDYQQGPRYNLATLREAVFYRDNYKCVVCGRSAIKDNAILHVHHMYYWKGRHGNKLDELIAVCEKCHTPANHQKGGRLYGFGKDRKFSNLIGAAFMNAVRWQIVEALYVAYGRDFVTVTYGAMTKEKRIALGIPKTHNNDAYAMGDFHPADRCDFVHYQKRRRNNRILEKFYDATYIDYRTGKKAKGQELFNGHINRSRRKDSENLHKYRSQKISSGRRSVRKQRYEIQPGDVIRFERKNYVTSGCHNKGTRVLIPVGGESKSVAVNKIKLIGHASAWTKVI